MAKDFANSKWKEYISIDLIIIESGLKKNLKDILLKIGFNKNIALVSDENTYDVLGKDVELSFKGSIKSMILPSSVEPSFKYVKKVRGFSKGCDFIVAVGSGTINDICKYSSFLEGKPYAVFGTAPSMNGYSSANASIIIEGHKKTLPAHLPKGIFMDLDILSNSPLRLIKSGLGDSICRSTCQIDWFLSHRLLGTKYDQKPFEMLVEYENDLFSNSDLLVKGDRDTIGLLCNNLIASGVGMHLCGGSYPASQGEHLIAHTMEMVHGKKLKKTYHGEQIATSSITMALIQEKVCEKISSDDFFVEDESLKESEILAYFGDQIGKQCIIEYKRKQNKFGSVGKLNEKLQEDGKQIVKEIESNRLDSAYLKKVLKKAGVNFIPSYLGWSEDIYGDAIKYSKYIRDRFTFLDLYKNN